MHCVYFLLVQSFNLVLFLGSIFIVVLISHANQGRGTPGVENGKWGVLTVP